MTNSDMLWKIFETNGSLDAYIGYSACRQANYNKPPSRDACISHVRDVNIVT